MPQVFKPMRVCFFEAHLLFILQNRLKKGMWVQKSKQKNLCKTHNLLLTLP